MIKLADLQPTKENIIQTLEDNIFNRNDIVYHFVKLCNEISDCISISIDAKWGNGKTFFIHQAILLIESLNSKSNYAKQDEKEKLRLFFDDLYRDTKNIVSQTCIYYNAWLNDNEIDPMLSLVYEMTTNSLQYYSTKETQWAEVLSAIFDSSFALIPFFKINFKAICDSAKKGDILEQIKKQKHLAELINDFLIKYISDHCDRLIIFIDELDRCKPTFAIKLLERIKHFMFNKKITFVFSVNIEQLQHTVKRYYGDEFDACKYLNRFFDLKFILPDPDYANYYRKNDVTDTYYFHMQVCKILISKYSFSIREANKYIQMVKIIINVKKLSDMYHNLQHTRALYYLFTVLIPIIICLNIHNTTLHNKFIKGESSDTFLEIMNYSEEIKGINRTHLKDEKENDECYENDKIDRLTRVYDYIFKSNYSRTNHDSLTIGLCTFNAQMVNYMFSAMATVLH